MSMTPSASTVASVGLGIPIATVGAWLLQTYSGVEMPGEVQAALGALISAGIGYAFRGGRARDVVPPP